ncbi:variant erythrocyte surface antigen-1 family protein [Babesia caballi]|uniref:Variant erythrocyte surface antigen-1 family protein n=1 Tax=Babesia caballi TaxID=5871 RepID=A0AAV4LYU8_BABCB|nr:variant erythrocyte surface antigen-1 family protein [Babesia caballi]
MTGHGQKKSLSDPPESLKDAVDWVLCMSGNDVPIHYTSGQEAIKMLAEKITSLLANVRVQGVAVSTLIQGDAKGHGSLGSHAPINSLASGLKALIDHTNGMGNEHIYSYGDDNPSQTVKDEKAAKTFLGSIPLIFFGIGFLFYTCRQDGGRWSKQKLSVGPIKDFFESVGFHIEQLNGAKNGYDAVSYGLAMLPEFRVDSSSKDFSDFLKEVEKQTNEKLSSDPNYAPLGALYLFSYKYLKAQKRDTLTTLETGIPNNENDIITVLKQLGEAVNTPELGTLTQLSSVYTQLGASITEALKAPDPSEESSVAGPVTGTLATAGLLGGGSAVYFNVGGAGTFLKGLLNFR